MSLEKVYEEYCKVRENKIKEGIFSIKKPKSGKYIKCIDAFDLFEYYEIFNNETAKEIINE